MNLIRQKRLGQCPRRFVSFYLYLRPHQVIDRLCPVIVRRDRADVGVAPVLGIRPEGSASIIPFAAAGVDRQIALPNAHVTRPQVVQLVPGLAVFAAKLSVSSRNFSNPSIQIAQVRFLTQLFQYNCNSSPDYSRIFLAFVTIFLVISVVCKLNFAQIPIAMALGNEYTI